MADRLRVATALALGVSSLLVMVGAAAPLEAATVDTPGTIDVEGDVRFEVAEGGVLTLDGDRRYFDTLELLAAEPTLVNELSMERYVAGVAEMPSRWPMEALKAQAVAARTYAWYSMGLGTFEHHDICATTACQVFRGADVVLDGGERWWTAVQDTAGQVLVDGEGEPILARYFSTSGGRTYANEEVFPSSGARDHLVAMDDPDDAVSPYHRWTVAFTREEFDEILSRGQTLAATVPVASVERLGPVTDQGAALLVTGVDGTEVEVGAEALRDFLSRVAPTAFPDRFPTARNDGLRPLPTTIPSTRFEVEVDDDEVVVHGRGWGHGVGMGQYGARGRADRGEDHTAILAAYYDGLEPTTPAALPDRIRVGLDAGDEHTIAGDHRVVITDAAGTVLVEPALGSWRVVRDGAGWQLHPPPGSDAQLEVAATRIVDRMFELDDAVTVETDVNKPVLLHLEVRDREDEVVLTRELGAADAGTHAATWRLVDREGRGVPAGDYEVALLATDAQGVNAGAGVDVTLEADARDLPPDDPAVAEPGGSGSDPGGFPTVVLAAALALPLALGVVVIATRRARS